MYCSKWSSAQEHHRRRRRRQVGQRFMCSTAISSHAEPGACVKNNRMSAGGPFRSHLLQQWGRSTQGRAPAAVATWLKSSPPSDSSKDAEGKTLLLDSDGGRTRHSHYLPQGPSISTLDSVSYGMEAGGSATASWEASPHSHTPRPLTTPPPPTLRPERRSNHQTSTRMFATIATATTDLGSGKLPSEAPLHLSPHDSRHEQRKSPERRTRLLSSTASSHQRDHPPVFDDERHEVTGIDPSMTTAFQSLLMTRRTASHWKGPSQEGTFSSVAAEEKLKRALDRAVACAQMAPNHKRTEPFSFKRFLMGSKAANHLADISYNVTLRKSGSEPNAHAKRLKWLAIPGFLVMLVHENQRSSSSSEGSSVQWCESDDYRYALLPYSPPETERQLEDVSETSDSPRLDPKEVSPLFHSLSIL